MIMLITCSCRRVQLQHMLQSGVGEPIHLVESAAEAVRWLRSREYTALVLDSTACDAEPAFSRLMRHMGSAVPVYVNLAVANSARITGEVKRALQRRHAERVSARKTASAELRDELRNAVTGILLSSELALETPMLPTVVQTKLSEVYRLADGMRTQLGI